jgi:hypothetical protein
MDISRLKNAYFKVCKNVKSLNDNVNNLVYQYIKSIGIKSFDYNFNPSVKEYINGIQDATNFLGGKVLSAYITGVGRELKADIDNSYNNPFIEFNVDKYIDAFDKQSFVCDPFENVFYFDPSLMDSINISNLHDAFDSAIHPYDKYAVFFNDCKFETMITVEKRDEGILCTEIALNKEDGLMTLDPVGFLFTPGGVCSTASDGENVNDFISNNVFKDYFNTECARSIYIILTHFLVLLNDKKSTIETSPGTPDRMVGKKKKRRKVLGKTEYKVLNISIGGKVYRSDTKYEELSDGESKLSRVMRHTRTYTKERPLLGHFVGTVIVEPHTRGSKDNGEIHKEYRLTKGK